MRKLFLLAIVLCVWSVVADAQESERRYIEVTGISYIGVATSDSPLHEFTDHGPIVEYGKEAIDAFIYDDNGQLYISWKAYGLDTRPIELLGCKLSADGLHLDGEPFTLLVDEKGIGMEGQYHFKEGDYYYIVYAAHGCCGPSSDYDVYVARARNYGGPYEKYSGNPILHGGEGDYKSCGHGTVVRTSDGRMFYMCHAYLKGDGFFIGRQPILQEMEMTDDHWVRFKTGNLAIAEQPIPFVGTKQEPLSDFEDNFKGNQLKVDWTWNYPYSDIHAVLKKGKLFLSGTPKNNNKYGTALCLRPQSPQYSCETKVINTGKGLKGLTLYGDDKNLIAWGIEGDKLILKVVKDDIESVLYDSAFASKEIYLKLEVEQGCIFHFYKSLDGKTWQSVQNTPFKGKSLIRWDRVQRPDRNNSHTISMFQKELDTLRTTKIHQNIQRRQLQIVLRQGSFKYIQRPRTSFTQNQRDIRQFCRCYLLLNI